MSSFCDSDKLLERFRDAALLLDQVIALTVRTKQHAMTSTYSTQSYCLLVPCRWYSPPEHTELDYCNDTAIRSQYGCILCIQTVLQRVVKFFLHI
jgi:hypothetical protein